LFTLRLFSWYGRQRKGAKAMKEHDIVTLTVDLPEYNLKCGAVGTIVHVYNLHVYEVEFTGVVVTLVDTKIRKN
jgi:hypothetical protein